MFRRREVNKDSRGCFHAFRVEFDTVKLRASIGVESSEIAEIDGNRSIVGMLRSEHCAIELDQPENFGGRDFVRSKQHGECGRLIDHNEEK